MLFVFLLRLVGVRRKADDLALKTIFCYVSLAESFKDICGSKRAVLSMVIMICNINCNMKLNLVIIY
jgi:hypothetical protein